jgi:hypothetical protein
VTLPNDSFLSTPDGSGTALATHLVSAKEYPVVMLADRLGQLAGSEDLYVATALAMAKAANKNYLSVFNADATGVIVDILAAYVVHEVTAAVTGLVRGYRLHQITAAHSVGTLITPEKVDTASPALDADVTVRANGQTAAAVGAALAVASVYEEETGGGVAQFQLWPPPGVEKPIPLGQNRGVLILQDATAGTGVLSASIVFRQR